jgi:glycosyltransferase involved in cell wall biosynthesis
MRIALVHDCLNEFGGAERVLLALSEAFPDAPIYTAFCKRGSPAWERFKDKDIHPSWAHYIPFFNRLYSPLRFLTPLIWLSFNFKKYDVVLSSSSWYITKGFRKGKNTREICYCHTPPRWLYGFKTSVELQRFWIVRLYAHVVGHFMRLYDFSAAQKVTQFIANSKNVADRIWKFYRRESIVIYPPVSLPRVDSLPKKQDYYLIITRIVGAKGLDLAVHAAIELGINLKIAGKATGLYTEYKDLQKIGKNNVEFLGYVSDEELVRLYAGAKAFLVLSADEDFGITPVESMLMGTPVIAFHGGGYLETVIEGKTGTFFNESTVDSLIDAIKRFEKMKFNPKDCIAQAQKFSKENFIKKIKNFISLPGSSTK